MHYMKPLVLVLISTLSHGAEIVLWQNSCCGTSRSLPRNWTDALCWSTRSVPGVNDRALFQVNKDCFISLNTADSSVNIGELYIANVNGFEMQLIGPVGGSNNNFSVGAFAITSSSVLTILDQNVIFIGASSLDGKLNLTDCRATGPGGITINSGSLAQLVLFRSPPYTLEFHVSNVTVYKGGRLNIISNILLSSSRIQILGNVEVDVEKITELRGA